MQLYILRHNLGLTNELPTYKCFIPLRHARALTFGVFERSFKDQKNAGGAIERL